jgi:tRNA modification GTPase
MYDLADTICALSTVPGRSGVALVRMSGRQSLKLVTRVFAPRRPAGDPPMRYSVVGKIVDPRDGSEIDTAITTCFKGPHSYTGEDMVEFSLHGSPVLVSALLDSLCELGARLADPGEFTMRAFLNGRMDLTQAEAVRDIIEATTVYQAQVAARQHSGAMALKLQPLKELLIDIIANLESAVEFVEEVLPLQSREELLRKLTNARGELGSWIGSFRQGKVIREGFSMAVAGRPNVGKSSVFNVLLSQDRSIVAETPGTTRDMVSEFAGIGGIPVRLLDTAGIRSTEDLVENLGIGRSFQAMAEADVILLVSDISLPRSHQDWALREKLADLPCILVMNKSDLLSQWSENEIISFSGKRPWVRVSAKTGAGVEDLRSAILESILGTDRIGRDGMIVTNLRHCRVMETAEKNLMRAEAALRDGLSEEFAISDLRRGLQQLGAITGETGTEEILYEIFSRFCIGK